MDEHACGRAVRDGGRFRLKVAVARPLVGRVPHAELRPAVVDADRPTAQTARLPRATPHTPRSAHWQCVVSAAARSGRCAHGADERAREPRRFPAAAARGRQSARRVTSPSGPPRRRRRRRPARYTPSRDHAPAGIIAAAHASLLSACGRHGRRCTGGGGVGAATIRPCPKAHSVRRGRLEARRRGARSPHDRHRQRDDEGKLESGLVDKNAVKFISTHFEVLVVRAVVVAPRARAPRIVSRMAPRRRALVARRRRRATGGRGRRWPRRRRRM